jgi:5-methylcytosine-specific restriction endonuclease McrA
MSKQKSWDSKRAEVYLRDNGVCDICTIHLRFEDFECGHIVDRCCGGSDDLDNLVVMCTLCNRVIKDLHETKEEYERWKKTQPYDRFFEGLVKHLYEPV